MITRIYSVYDNKAEAYMAPFTTSNAGLALRTFADTVNNPDSIFAKHPDDFVLFELGTFDDVSGRVDPYTENKILGHAREYLKEE